MASAVAQADAFGFRNAFCAFKVLILVENEENAVVFIKPLAEQIFARYADADLAEKHGRFVRAVELAYGHLHVKRIADAQRFFDPDKAAGRQRFHLDHVKRRAARVAYHAQTAVYLALDNGKLALLFQNLFLLTAELLLNDVNISVLEKIADRAERHIQHAQIAHGVKRLELPHAVVAIARVGVRVLGRDKPKRFIVAQRTGAEVEKPGNVAYGKQLAFIQGHARPFRGGILFCMRRCR